MIIEQLNQGNGLRIDYKSQLNQDIEHCREKRETLEIVVTTCPPYATKDGVFLFNGETDENPGIVANETLKQLIPLLTLLEDRSVPTKISFIYADQELDDEIVMRTLNSIEKAKADLTFGMHQLVYQANTLLYSLGIGNIVSVDVDRMSERIFKPESINRARNFISALDNHTLNTIVYERRDLYSRMYARLLSQKHSDELFTTLALRDIYEHICFGEAVRLERARGHKACVATMSIPHLSKFFNSQSGDSSESKIPVISIRKKY